jgi:type I restriction enzyme S subunit
MMGAATMKVKHAALKIGSGKTPNGGAQTYVDEGVLFLRSQNVHFDGLRLDDVAFIDSSVDADMASTRVMPNDLLLNITGASLGRVAIAPATLGSANVNQHVCIIRPSRRVVPRFLLWCLQSGPIQERIVELQVGGNRDGLNFEQVGEFSIPDVPLATQGAIADYLDRETAQIDALIAAKGRMVELLEERRQVRRDEMLRLVDAPMVKIGRFVESIGQGVSPEAEARPTGSDEWGVLKLSAVKTGRFIPSEHKALPAGFAPIPSLVPKAGDLLVTRANTPPLVGDACAVMEPVPRLMLCDLIYVLRLRPGLDPEYAAQALLSKAARLQLSSAARGTSQSMVKLRAEDVKAVAIPVPDITTQRLLISRLTSDSSRVERMTTALEKSIDLLQERRRALIAAAVTGRLDTLEAA